MKLVAHNGSRVWGGNEKWLSMVATGLTARDHEVVVSCRAGGVVAERLAVDGIRTAGFRPGGDLDLLALARFSRWLRKERPDTVLATSWNRLAAVGAACRLAGVPRLVVRLGLVRGYPSPGPTRWVVARAVDALIVNSAAIGDEWRRMAPPAVADRLFLVHNAIVPPTLPPPGHREALRRGLGLRTDTRLIAAAGHIFPRKGFDLLLNALALLPHHDTHLAIAGSGPHERALREQAGRLGIDSRVHWLGLRSDVPDILAAADVFVLSSRNEGMANVMLEAMSVGCPVVATAVSGVNFAIAADGEAGPAGWIVPPDDEARLAHAIWEVLEDSAGEAAVRTAEAKRRIRTRFAPDRMLDEVEDVLFPRLQ